MAEPEPGREVKVGMEETTDELAAQSLKTFNLQQRF
jgi:hypothetical protein